MREVIRRLGPGHSVLVLALGGRNAAGRDWP